MITGKHLKARGWPEGKLFGLAKTLAQRLEQHGMPVEAVFTLIDQIRVHPEHYVAQHDYADLAWQCIAYAEQHTPQQDEHVRSAPLEYATWGTEYIESEAKAQMARALMLPVAIGGALMPDAHVGYGLPIGGVLATDNAVVPYAVGVDIACRMRISIFPQSPIMLGQRAKTFQLALTERTRFGLKEEWDTYDRPQHAILDDPAWEATRSLKSLQIKAARQLGTSGSGNHFVEWGEATITQNDPALGVEPGTYLALLSHSGSRGVGYSIATTYTDIAHGQHPNLDAKLRILSWLMLTSEAGQEYWLAMELAGRFAAANHEVIHQRVAQFIGIEPLGHIENHHNFAWRETLPDGTNAIIHRKGATPAAQGVLGIIPGSMGDVGYIVRGRGFPNSLNSASHGAGRAMSRAKAVSTITKTLRDTYLKQKKVTLLGGGVDESPQAYKDIQSIINAQADLIDIIGTFTPRIVRMADEHGEY